MGFFNKFKSKLEQAIKEKWKKDVVKKETGGDVNVAEKSETKASVRVAPEKKAQRGSGKAYRILSYPLVTEKTAMLAGSGKYIFVVNPKTTKIEIKKAVKDVYGIMPMDVNIINRKGKKVRFGRREGTRKDWKKAIVTMPEGKTLPIYE